MIITRTIRQLFTRFFGWLWPFRHYEKSQESTLLFILAAASKKGLPLVPLLEVYYQQRSNRWHRKVREFIGHLKLGETVIQAVKNTHGLFSPEIQTGIQLGHDTDTLPEMFDELAKKYKVDVNEQTRFTTTIMYFICMLSFFWIIVGFLSVFIVPKFKMIFADFGVDLPPMSQWYFSFSEAFVLYFGILFFPLFVVLPLVVLFIQGQRRGNFASWITGLDRMLFPAKWATILEWLSVPIQKKIPVDKFFDSLASRHTRHKYKRKFQRVRDAITSGENHFSAIRANGLITAREKNLLDAAERGGNLPWMIKHVASLRKNRIENFRSLFFQISTPLVLIFIFLVIGFYAISMVLPLISLIENLG